MKKVTVSVAGSGALHDLEIQPATTAQDILRQINLQGYVLTKAGGNPNPFAATENVYAAVQDGDKLIASPPASVGQEG